MWTMNVIKLLLELYLHADLKLNLKFEVEVMLNALKLNIEGMRHKMAGLACTLFSN